MSHHCNFSSTENDETKTNEQFDQSIVIGEVMKNKNSKVKRMIDSNNCSSQMTARDSYWIKSKYYPTMVKSKTNDEEESLDQLTDVSNDGKILLF
jgi:hypothetical protein